MRFNKYSHACVRIESDGAVLVIDPGEFTERSALSGVDAVLITHEHADHLDVEALTDALATRPSVRIFTHAAVAAHLGDLAEVTTIVASGERFAAAGFRVRAHGGWHAVIHPEIPPVPNLGFLVEESIYHPGDSFDLPLDADVQTLLVPISGPWLKVSDSIDFVRAAQPRRAIALHDCLLSDIGHRIYDANMSRLSGCEYRRLIPGEELVLS